MVEYPSGTNINSVMGLMLAGYKPEYLTGSGTNNVNVWTQGKGWKIIINMHIYVSAAVSPKPAVAVVRNGIIYPIGKTGYDSTSASASATFNPFVLWPGDTLQIREIGGVANAWTYGVQYIDIESPPEPIFKKGRRG